MSRLAGNGAVGDRDRMAALNVAVMIPSRGRPAALRDAITCAQDHAASGVALYVGLDGDDDADYTGIGIEVAAVVHAKGRMRLGAWLNTLSKLALDDGQDVIGFTGDDHRLRTDGWDTLVTDAMPSMVYGDDLLQGERLPTACFWHRDVIAALGFYCPPVLTHFYLDDFWLRLATDLQCRTYLSGLVVEHLHPSAGKADRDATYDASEPLLQYDRVTFARYLAERYATDLQRAKAALT